ncbi:hypothetical protein KR067_011384 [Drosophila pandora]|nr:hypothetical protein KR067_011384 [Drosophila pandora]
MLGSLKVQPLPLVKMSQGLIRHLSDINSFSLNANFVKGSVRVEPVSLMPASKYGGVDMVTLLTGTTLIGQQGSKYVQAMLQSSRVPVEVQVIDPLETDDFYNSVLRNRSAVHVENVVDAEAKKKSMKLCNDLDLYMFKCRMRSFPGFNCRFPDVNIRIIAQNNKGVYSDLEYSPVKGVVEAISVGTQEGNEKYLRKAFATAVKANRKRVTLIHKSTEWPITDGAMVSAAKEIHKDYEHCLELELMNVEDCIGRLITHPQEFDCIFSSDRYATMIATMCSGICGGANLFSAVEIGDFHAVFKPLQVKLSVTNYPILSPYGIVNTIVDLFDHLGYTECSDALWEQMLRTMKSGIKTKDFGGEDSGEYVICNIINRLRCRGFQNN